MLRVHGDDLRPLLLCPAHHQVPGAHQGLLIGQGNAFALVNGGQGGLQSGDPHHGGDHGVRLGQRGGLHQALPASYHTDGGVSKALFQILGSGFVHRHHQLGLELPGLLLGQLHAAVYRQGRHLVAADLGHVQGLPTDGAGGA